MAKTTAKLPLMKRTVALKRDDIQVIERGEGEKKQTVYRFPFSSEFEAVRYDWWTGERYVEVLSHEPDAVVLDRMNNRAPWLHMHDPYDQIGVVEKAETGKDKRAYAEARFSSVGKGPDFEADWNDDVRTQISTAYRVHEQRIIKGDAKAGVLERRIATRWEPMEVSIVSMALDPTVGKGRATTDGERKDVELFTVVNEDGEPVTEETRAMDKEKEGGAAASPAPERTTSSPAAVAELELGKDEAQKARDARDEEVRTICRNNKVPPARELDFLRSDMPATAVARIVNEMSKTPAVAQPGSESLIDLSAKDVKRFSYARALDGAMRLKGHERGKFEGLEREVHDELLSKAPDGFDYHGGVLIPLRLDPTGLKRSMDTKTPGAGQELVPQIPGELIEFLRDESLLTKLGATQMVGLTAKVPFPKQKSGMQFFWQAENPPSDITASDVSLGLSWLDPKALAGMNIFSRQLLMMALVDMDNLIRREIAVGIALALDLAGIHGKGAEGVPLGIYRNPDVTTKAIGGQPTYTQVIDMFAQVRKRNAHKGRLGFATTPEMSGVLMGKPMFTNGALPIWQGTFDDGRVVGYPAVASTQISALMSGVAESGGTEHGMLAGNFEDLIIGTYAMVEVTADPYTLMGKAMIRLFGYFMADTLLRHGESLTVSTGATLT